MEKYHELLSSHFSGEQIETLIKLINLMQDPFSFEIGILQLKAHKLYDPFMQFLKQICSPYLNVDGVDDMKLLTYMFNEKIMVGYRIVFGEGASLERIHKPIFLPLFPKKLEMEIRYNRYTEFIYNDWYLPPIHIKVNSSTFVEFPITTFSVDVDCVSDEDDMEATYYAIPNHVTTIRWSEDFLSSHNFWGEGFMRFSQLEKLELQGKTLNDNLRLHLPPTVEDLNLQFYFYKVKFLDIYELVARCLEEAPLLGKLRIFTAYFNDTQLEQLDTLLAKYNFNYNPTKDLYERIS